YGILYPSGRIDRSAGGGLERISRQAPIASPSSAANPTPSTADTVVSAADPKTWAKNTACTAQKITPNPLTQIAPIGARRCIVCRPSPSDATVTPSPIATASATLVAFWAEYRGPSPSANQPICAN